MTKQDLQWLAGVIDAEGSIEVCISFGKRNGYKVLVRKHRMRISTTDNIIVPYIAKILNRHFKGAKLYRKSITMSSNECRELLLKLIPFLYLKQPQARILVQAMSIKSSKNTPYTKKESDKWNELYQKIRLLNLRGKDAPVDNNERQHKFSWPWLAGLIDGDGTITNAEFGPRNRPILKPVVKISLTNLKAIEYIGDKLGIKSLCSGGGKGNKRKTRVIRFMSNNIYNIMPKIIPYLTLKKERAELALKVVKLRREIPNGQYNHPNVKKAKEFIQQINELNLKRFRRSLP